MLLILLTIVALAAASTWLNASGEASPAERRRFAEEHGIGRHVSNAWSRRLRLLLSTVTGRPRSALCAAVARSAPVRPMESNLAVPSPVVLALRLGPRIPDGLCLGRRTLAPSVRA